MFSLVIRYASLALRTLLRLEGTSSSEMNEMSLVV